MHLVAVASKQTKTKLSPLKKIEIKGRIWGNVEHWGWDLYNSSFAVILLCFRGGDKLY